MKSIADQERKKREHERRRFIAALVIAHAEISAYGKQFLPFKPEAIVEAVDKLLKALDEN